MPSFVFNKAAWTLSEYQGGQPPKQFVFKMLVSSFFCWGHNQEENLFLSAIFGDFVSCMEVKVHHRSSPTATAPATANGDETVAYGVELKCVGGIHILYLLKKQFGDKVKVRASLTVGNGTEVISSTEPMSIDESYTCRGSLSPLTSRDLDRLVKEAVVGQCGLKVVSLQFDLPEMQGDTPRTPSLANSNSEMGELKEVRQLNKNILEEALCSDLFLTSQDGAKVEAHRSFLSAASPVFKAMFKNRMKESLTGELDMPTMSEKAVKAFLSYLYTKDVSEYAGDSQVAFELLRAGHQYEIPALATSMMARLAETKEGEMGVKLAFEIYAFVKNLDEASNLKEKAVKVLKMNWKDFKESPECKEFFENKEAIIELCGDLAEY